MKLKFILLTVLIIANSLFALQAQTVAEEPPTSNGIYQVSTLAHLRWISENISSWTSDFEQVADIDASETSTWNVGDHDNDIATPDEPMGIIPIGTISDKFTGMYNGNGFTVSGLYINRPEALYVGLFGYIYNAEIHDISVINANITGDQWVGALVGYSWESTITYASSSGEVSGHWDVGGLVGLTYRYSEISYSNSSCSVSATGGFVGGFIGANMYSYIEYSYSTGSVSSNSTLGGFAGVNESGGATIKKCYSTATVNGKMLMGGFVGRTSNSTIEDCYSSGDINISSIYTSVGGFVGRNYTNGIVQDCYTISLMSTTWDIYHGGFAGENDNTIQNCFWNTDIEVTDNGLATGLTTAEMKQQCTFVDGTYASWDFMEETVNGIEDNWGMNASENDGYPFLAFQGYTQTEECCGFVDLTDPVLSAENITLYLDASGSVALSAAEVVTSATDNCSITDTTLSQSVFNCSETGENTVDVTLIDEGGNTDVEQITVTVIDDIDPELIVDDLTIYLDESGNASLSAADVVIIATDNCSLADTTLSQSAFNCSETGTVIVDVTLTDASGNMDIKQASITILDTISPNLTVQNLTLYLNESGSATISSTQVVASATDNCELADTTLSQTAINCSESGEVTVDVTLTDVSGNAEVKHITVTVLDTIAPDLLVENITIYLNESGIAILEPSQVVTEATDNCTIADTTLSQTTFNCTETGEMFVDVSLFDASGNSDVKQIMVTVIDTISPVLSAQNITLYLDENGSATLSASDIVTNSTDNCSIADTILSQYVFDCSENNAEVEVTLSDVSGNTDSEFIIVSLIDAISPELSVQNATIYLDESGSAILLPSQVVTGATDNCTLADTILSQTIFDCDDLLVPVNVVVTLIDAAGNEVAKEVVITVEDNLAPELNVQNITLELDENESATLNLSDVVINATDNCMLADTLLSQTSFDCDDILAPVSVDITLIDISGNEVVETAVITVTESILPELSVQDFTLELDENGAATLLASNVVTSATDNCTLADTILSKTFFDCDDISAPVSVDVTLIDASGNEVVKTVMITVIESILPELSVQDFMLELDENGAATLLASDVVTNATDNCTLADTILSRTSFDCDDISAPVSVEVTLIDASGNEITETVIVTVIESILPELSVQDFTLELDENGAAILISSDVVTNATDNCTLADTILSRTSFDCDDILAPVSVDITLIDISGNEVVETAVITVTESILPQLSVQDFTLELDENGVATLLASDVVTSATDNCSLADTILSQSEFTTADLGEQTISVTITDASGNQTTKQANITILEYVGIQNGLAFELIIYPNPAKDYIQILSEKETIQQIEILDYAGSLVLNRNFNQHNCNIDLSSLKSGLYYVKVMSGENYQVLKLIKK